jgi:hypothetical protein
MQVPCFGKPDPVVVDKHRSPCMGDQLPLQYLLVPNALVLHRKCTVVLVHLLAYSLQLESVILPVHLETLQQLLLLVMVVLQVLALTVLPLIPLLILNQAVLQGVVILHLVDHQVQSHRWHEG